MCFGEQPHLQQLDSETSFATWLVSAIVANSFAFNWSKMNWRFDKEIQTASVDTLASTSTKNDLELGSRYQSIGIDIKTCAKNIDGWLI